MAVERIIEEVKKLSPREQKRLFDLMKKEVLRISEVDGGDNGRIALKKLDGLISDPEGGSHTYEEDIYGGPAPL